MFADPYLRAYDAYLVDAARVGRLHVTGTDLPATDHPGWLNVELLQRARLVGPERYRSRLAELELLRAAKMADLLTPRQVVLRLAVAGFGVVLPPEFALGQHRRVTIGLAGRTPATHHPARPPVVIVPCARSECWSRTRTPQALA